MSWNDLTRVNILEQMRTVGPNTFMKLHLIEDVEDLGGQQADYAIVGIPDDSGEFFRVGQRFAPNSIREYSAMLRPYHINMGVDVMAELKGFDYGDVNCIPNRTEFNQNRAYEKVVKLVEKGIIPISLGGDHSIALPDMRAVAKVHGPIGLVHFDSHIDTQDEFYGNRYNNGTALRRAIEEGILDPARTISIGIKGTQFEFDETHKSRDLGIEVITMDEFEEIGVEETVRRILDRIGDGKTFLTFDIDCMDTSCAPGGGVYELGGFTTREIIRILKGIKEANFVGFDISEVCPAYDPSGITSYMAAAIVHTFMAMIAIRKRKEKKD